MAQAALPQTNWRRGIAAQIATTYARQSGAAAVLLGGSTGRGHPDRFSDIELGVFWDTPPSQPRRHELILASGGLDERQFGFFDHEQAWYDEFFIGRAAPEQAASGLLIEVVHKTTAAAEEQIRAIINDFNPDEYGLNLVSAIAYGQPLHGEALLGRWRGWTTPYPPDLARAVIKKHGQIDLFWRWPMFLERGPNLTMLYRSWSEIITRLLHLLCAVNGIYFFGFKWQNVVCAQLVRRPDRLNERLGAVFTRPPAEAAGILAALVEETYHLVSLTFPDINVARWREIFTYQRQPWIDGRPADSE